MNPENKKKHFLKIFLILTNSRSSLFAKVLALEFPEYKGLIKISHTRARNSAVSGSNMLRNTSNKAIKALVLSIRSLYSKTCLKWPLSKRPQIGFQDKSLLNASQKYCRMLLGEHSAILSTFIKLPFVIEIFILSIFEWPFYTGFPVQ